MASFGPVARQERGEEVEFARLKAESDRLRREMLRSGLEISYTIARFWEAKPDSQALDESCRSAARKAVARLERMLGPGLPVDAELKAKMDELRAALEERQKNGANGDSPVNPPRRDGPVATRVTDALTRRETEVLKHIAEGNSTKKVAEILGITFKTAACHRYRVMDKLGIHETANLVRYAIRQGMVEP
jgi:DNA-binding NarL/FixJ family response regulator